MGSEPWYAITSALIVLGTADDDDPPSFEAAREEATATLEGALGPKASLTLTETARLLGVSTNTLKDWIARDLIPVESFSGHFDSRHLTSNGYVTARGYIPHPSKGLRIISPRLRRCGQIIRLKGLGS